MKIYVAKTQRLFKIESIEKLLVMCIHSYSIFG